MAQLSNAGRCEGVLGPFTGKNFAITSKNSSQVTGGVVGVSVSTCDLPLNSSGVTKLLPLPDRNNLKGSDEQVSQKSVNFPSDVNAKQSGCLNPCFLTPPSLVSTASSSVLSTNRTPTPEELKLEHSNLKPETSAREKRDECERTSSNVDECNLERSLSDSTTDTSTTQEQKTSSGKVPFGILGQSVENGCLRASFGLLDHSKRSPSVDVLTFYYVEKVSSVLLLPNSSNCDQTNQLLPPRLQFSKPLSAAVTSHAVMDYQSRSNSTNRLECSQSVLALDRSPKFRSSNPSPTMQRIQSSSISNLTPVPIPTVPDSFYVKSLLVDSFSVENVQQNQNPVSILKRAFKEPENGGLIVTDNGVMRRGARS